MFLKKIETVGFKSFAERIQVDFVPGVTAIVGPNGSGKSNITDAIRWVLGEQSAKSLRGSKMEDIIFQGSDSRNKLNVAEVTLVLDNSKGTLPLDYEEVSVTRRVYRSGESEFYLNKQACRLKDIVDLFMDSGLGKNAFSIIGQGKIEEILSSKAEERRVIFEEAAGVLKYKQRKQQAEFKLGETAENLFRVEDIIYEIEQQLTPLKEQSRLAKVYMDLKENLKHKEITLLITEIDQLHREWKDLKEKLQKEEKDEIAIVTTIQKKEAMIQEKRQQIQNMDAKVEQQQENLLDATQKLENLEGKKKIFYERSKHFITNKENLETKKQALQDRVHMISENYTKEKNQLKLMVRKKQEIEDKVIYYERKLSKSTEDLEKKIEQLKTMYIDQLNKQAADRNEIKSIQQQMDQLSVKEEKIQQRHIDFVQSLHEIEKKEKAALLELEQEQTYYDDKYAQKAKEKENIQVLETKLQQFREKYYQSYRDMEQLKSRKESLEGMKEEFQGFYQGVKAVLKAWKNGQLQGIQGAVIDVITIPDNLLTAMETVLGTKAQHIVTNHDEAARKAIAWLKKTNNGRATFLPLQSIKSRFVPINIQQQLAKHPGYIGIASELVQTDSAFTILVEHLMGHVIIARTLKDAIDIAKQTQRKFRIVTLEGDVVNPGGSMSGGGKRKQTSSLFTRDNELKKITKKLTTITAYVTHLEKQMKNIKDQVVQKKQALQLIDESLYHHYQLVQDTTALQKQLEERRIAIQKNIATLKMEAEEQKVEREQFKKRMIQKKDALHALKSTLKQTYEEIELLTEEQHQLQENQEGMEKAYHQARIVLAEQEERTKNKEENVQKEQQQLDEYRTSYQKTVKELQNLYKQQDEEENAFEIEERIQEQKEKKDFLMKGIQEQRRTRLQLMTWIEDQERELKETAKQHQQLVEKIQKKELHEARLDVELENRLTYLETEYRLTYEKATQTYKKTEDMEAEQISVEKLKQEVKQLGSVNLGAIDEYDRIQERYHFLTKQQADLLEAKETLHHVIDEMDEEMKRLFDTTFTKIKAEFTIVFKQLFGGGRAELSLTDPENLLDTGVDIIAQPPGKKLQNLGLLSGGERALTAIALLFAILRVRPVPFCVLDEVEAALDEANVVRFANYVKQHSEKTQFIVITHRKGTMEEADALYGVTMQESGVSRFVSVRLEELEDTGELVTDHS